MMEPPPAAEPAQHGPPPAPLGLRRDPHRPLWDSDATVLESSRVRRTVSASPLGQSPRRSTRRPRRRV
jgi:hypothetical protein